VYNLEDYYPSVVTLGTYAEFAKVNRRPTCDTNGTPLPDAILNGLVLDSGFILPNEQDLIVRVGGCIRMHRETNAIQVLNIKDQLGIRHAEHILYTSLKPVSRIKVKGDYTSIDVDSNTNNLGAELTLRGFFFSACIPVLSLTTLRADGYTHFSQGYSERFNSIATNSMSRLT